MQGAHRAQVNISLQPPGLSTSHFTSPLITQWAGIGLDLLITLKQQLALSSTFFQISLVPTFIFASEASCCLGLGGDCCIASVAEETGNHGLWPYMGNNGNGKFDTSAILGIQQCSFPPSGHCFMAYSRFYTALFPKDAVRMGGCSADAAALLLATWLLVVYSHISNDGAVPGLQFLHSSGGFFSQSDFSDGKLKKTQE